MKNKWIDTSHYIFIPGATQKAEVVSDSQAIRFIENGTPAFVATPISKREYRPHSTHKRVFKKGARIRGVNAFEKWTKAGGWIFWGKQKRAIHPGWARSWQFQMVSNALAYGVWKAVRIEEEWTNA